MNEEANLVRNGTIYITIKQDFETENITALCEHCGLPASMVIVESTKLIRITFNIKPQRLGTFRLNSSETEKQDLEQLSQLFNPSLLLQETTNSSSLIYKRELEVYRTETPLTLEEIALVTPKILCYLDQHYTISGCRWFNYDIDDNFLTYLVSLPNLQVLTFENCRLNLPPLTWDDIQAGGNFIFPVEHNLNSVTVKGCTSQYDNLLYLTRFRSVAELFLNNTGDELEDSEFYTKLATIIEYLPNLKLPRIWQGERATCSERDKNINNLLKALKATVSASQVDGLADILTVLLERNLSEPEVINNYCSC